MGHENSDSFLGTQRGSTTKSQTSFFGLVFCVGARSLFVRWSWRIWPVHVCWACRKGTQWRACWRSWWYCSTWSTILSFSVRWFALFHAALWLSLNEQLQDCGSRSNTEQTWLAMRQVQQAITTDVVDSKGIERVDVRPIGTAVARRAPLRGDRTLRTFSLPVRRLRPGLGRSRSGTEFSGAA